MEAKGQLKVNAESGSTAGSEGATAGRIDVRAAKCQHRFQALDARDQCGGNGAMKRIGRKIIYVMLVIVVLLIIWQFLGSL